MAHGDYHCCAVCDGKMAYSTDAETKERMCPDCAVDLSLMVGVPMKGVSDLVQWMECDPAQSVKVLQGLGFRTCYYSNDVDRAYRGALKRLDAREQQEGQE